MNNQNLESSKFYSYNFHNFSTMIILPAFILVILLFIGSFFAVHENVIKSIGVITPDRIISLQNNEYKEGQKLLKGTAITLINGKKRILKNNSIVHLDDKGSVIMSSLKDKSNLKVKTYVSSVEIATINKGQRVRFQIENNQGIPTILNGKVISIDIYPVEQKGINMFEVNTLIRTTKSERKFLRYGIQGKITIITGRTSYFNYLKSRILDTNRN